jgi:tetratricopeptide (TPR) repeat protein
VTWATAVLLQDAPSSDTGAWWITLLDELAEEPALVQIVVLLAVALVVFLPLARLRRMAREAAERRALEDFLIAVECAAHGDAKGAEARLRKVVEHEPGNAEARLLLGLVLGDLGRAVEAHAVHVEVERAFGVRSARNRVALARCLLEVGRAGEAVSVARGALELAPRDEEARQVLAQAELRSGGGRRSESSETPLLPGALELASEPGSEGRLVVVESSEVPVGSRSGWTCRICGLELPGRLPRCCHCGAENSATLQAPEFFAEAGSPSRLLDAIEQNDAHVRRLIRSILDANAARAIGLRADEAARELVVLGEVAVPAVLARAIELGPDDPRLIDVVRAMGPAVLPALFAAWSHGEGGARGLVWRARRSRGSRAAVEVVGRIVQGFDRRAWSAFCELLSTEDRDLRKVLIDYFLGCGPGEDVDHVLARFSAVEVVHRLNAAPREVLDRLLVGIADDSGDTEAVLLHLLRDPNFDRDIDVLRALPRARDAEALLEALRARGPNGRLLRAAVSVLGDPATEASGAAVLDGFGDAAIPLQLAVFHDTDEDERVRVALRRRLVSIGASIVPALCDGCLGGGPTPLDAEFVELLGGIGESAVPALVTAYRVTGFRERIGLSPRHTHRRVMIVRALATIGGYAARRALEGLRLEERDPSLVLRLVQASEAVATRAALPGGDADQGPGARRPDASRPDDERDVESGRHDDDEGGQHRVG